MLKKVFSAIKTAGRVVGKIGLGAIGLGVTVAGAAIAIALGAVAGLFMVALTFFLRAINLLAPAAFGAAMLCYPVKLAYNNSGLGEGMTCLIAFNLMFLGFLLVRAFVAVSKVK